MKAGVPREGLQPPSNRSTSLNSTSGVVENMSEPIQGEAPPPSVSRSRGKLIAIVVAVILVLVAVSAVAVYYLIPAGFSGTIKEIGRAHSELQSRLHLVCRL